MIPSSAGGGRSPLAGAAAASPPPSHLNNSYEQHDVAPDGNRSMVGGYSNNNGHLSRTLSLNSNAAPSPNGYFPQYPQQQQQYMQQQPDPDQDLTLLNNTRANAQSPYAGSAAPAPGGSAQQLDGPTILSPTATTPRPAKFTEEWDASQRGTSIIEGGNSNMMQRSHWYAGSTATSSADAQGQLSRGNTLKKKASLRRGGSLKRSGGSRRSMKAGSVRSLALQSNTDEDEMHSAFYCPVPTNGNPTEILANRFQAWRKIIKDLITYFRELQNHYEQRGKAFLKLSNVLNNTSMPPGFAGSGGLEDAMGILRNYNKQAIDEAAKARAVEEDVIMALTGLRSDLGQKIKEIKALSGDFKNSVDKEMEATRRAVKSLGEALGQSEVDSATATGRLDPYLLRLAVDRQLERQIEEENYLHRAYLNLESSGRELESIVVGEIQKSYNAYAGILKREADAAYSTVDELRSGPIAMPKDHEWSHFVKQDDKFVSPDTPVRSVQFIHYPGRDHYASQEVREGLLERKSKYLRSYTAGWYVLSPTHLHEFRSADKAQAAPLMSLYLPEQKLGSHSVPGASSNKFILKGRQTGSMHRGHTWVFRAESYDTMMAWYEDIKALSEKSPEERSTFVRGHSRSYSRASQRSTSSDGAVDEDDAADAQPFAPEAAAISSRQSLSHPGHDGAPPRRPSPGGRFPSDLIVNSARGAQVPPISPASVHSGINYQQHTPQQDNGSAAMIAAASALPGSDFGQFHDPRLGYGSTARTPLHEAASHAAQVSNDAREDGVNPYTSEPMDAKRPLSQNGGAAAAAYGGDYSQAGHDVGLSRGLSSHQQPQQVDGGAANGYSAAPVVVPIQSPQPKYAPSAVSSSGTSALESPSPSGGGANYESTGFAPPQDKQQQQPRTVAAANGGAGKGRPLSGKFRNDSATPTISNLHIPGGYPKPTHT